MKLRVGKKINFPEWVLGSLILVAFCEMVFLSLRKFAAFNMKYFDIGAMSQAVWSATRGLPLIFTGQGIVISRLSRNVELVYFLLAPIYTLFPSPRTLLVVQALVYASGAWPLYRLAYRRLQHGWLSVAIAAIYLFYPVAQTAVLAEFHSDPLAMAWLLFAIEAADRRAWRSYGLWLILALSCKFYVAAPVVALGVVLWLQGERKVGWRTVVLGVVWGAVMFFGVRAFFAPPLTETAAAVNVQASTTSYVQARFQLDFIRQTLGLRLVNAVIVLMPALLLLGWRAPFWWLPAAASFVPAILSSGFGPAFSYRTHHYALAVPFMLAAVVYGTAVQLQQPLPPNGKRPAWQGRVLLTLFVTIIFNLAFIDSPFSPFYDNAEPGSGQGLDSTRFGLRPRDRWKRDWLLEYVPQDVPVAADELSAVMLTNRERVFLTTYVFGRPLTALLPQTDVVIVDALYDYAVGQPDDLTRALGATIRHEYEVIALMMQSPDFELVQAQDGLLLFQRDGDGLNSRISKESGTALSSYQAQFGDIFGLVSAEIIPLAHERRFQVTCQWSLLGDTPPSQSLVAVSRLDGVMQSRIVHLGTSVLYPANQWQSGELITEQFDILLPVSVPAGTYPLMVGWYDPGSTFALYTDERSRIGQEAVLGWIEVK